MDHGIIAERYTPSDVTAIIDGAQALLDDGTYRVLVLNSAPASAWWGTGTRWCTANAGWFDGYRQYGELIFVEHRPSNRRWQLYIHNCEFRNARNRRANGQVFARTHPVVIEALRSRIMADCRAMLFFGLAAECVRIEHFLNLRGLPVESLPANLYVRDDLDLRATGIQQLPRGLHVGGDLMMSARTPPAIPSDLKVGGGIFLCDGWRLRQPIREISGIVATNEQAGRDC